MWSPELKHKLAELIGAISAVNDAANGGNAATAEQGCTLSLRFAQSNEAYGIAFELNCPDAFDMSIRPNRKPHPSASHDEDLPGVPELKHVCHGLATSRCAGCASIPAAMSYSGGDTTKKRWMEHELAVAAHAGPVAIRT